MMLDQDGVRAAVSAACDAWLTDRAVRQHDVNAAIRAMVTPAIEAYLDTAAAKKDETAHRKRAPEGTWR